MRCPFPFAPVILIWRVFSQFRFALQTRLVVGSSRTDLVVAGAGWNSILSSKAYARFMGKL